MKCLPVIDIAISQWTLSNKECSLRDRTMHSVSFSFARMHESRLSSLSCVVTRRRLSLCFRGWHTDRDKFPCAHFLSFLDDDVYVLFSRHIELYIRIFTLDCFALRFGHLINLVLSCKNVCQLNLFLLTYFIVNFS